MRIVVAPNAFKGSLSALEAATAIGEGIRNAVPDAEAGVGSPRPLVKLGAW